jgi:hypothetical protein
VAKLRKHCLHGIVRSVYQHLKCPVSDDFTLARLFPLISQLLKYRLFPPFLALDTLIASLKPKKKLLWYLNQLINFQEITGLLQDR